MPADDVQSGSLMHFHARMRHLSLDTIERMAKKPGSGIKIRNHNSTVCNSCKEGKQTKNKQSWMDTRKHAPIDRIGGVICSDLKGPLTPKDRLGNRSYLTSSTTSRTTAAFLARTTDKAAKRFEDFVLFFERMFKCKLHILRTDGGGEYMNVDLFCQRTEIARQVSEARNQASNGNAERTHRTYLTWRAARSSLVKSLLSSGETQSNTRLTSWIESRRDPIQDAHRQRDFDDEIPRPSRGCCVWEHMRCVQGPAEELAGAAIASRSHHWNQHRNHGISQPVVNIETLNAAQNVQLQRSLKCDGNQAITS